MNDDDALSREVEALIERGRVVRPVSDAVRARALARARATASGALPWDPRPLMGKPVRARGRRILLGAAAVLLLGGAGAFAAFRARTHAVPEPSAPVVGEVVLHPRPTAPEASPPPPSPPETSKLRPRRRPRPAAITDSYRAELALLEVARSAYAAHDFSAALRLVKDHARRFPSGHLAEEREALRVRSLEGAGHSAEAESAELAFHQRFPHSGLLPGPRM